MAHTKVYKMAADKLRSSCPYSRKYWTDFDYGLLDQIRIVKRPSKKESTTYNDIIIMLDTESSKDHKPKDRKDIGENHIVVWTISLRAYHHNMVTLYGRKPDEAAQCIKRIHEAMSGKVTVFYIHNLGWDWTFLRRFIMAELGTPKGQLNVKPYYPIYVEFSLNSINILQYEEKCSLIFINKKLLLQNGHLYFNNAHFLKCFIRSLIVPIYPHFSKIFLL